MRVEPYKNKFYRVSKATPQVVSYLKQHVKQDYRFFENGDWFVHESEVDAVKQLHNPTIPLASNPDTDYSTLHLLPTAPAEVVDAVWRKLAQLHHPDKGGSQADFLVYSAAYQRIRGKR